MNANILETLLSLFSQPTTLDLMPNMRLSFFEKFSMRQEIYRLSKQYKKFINTEDMPNFSVEFKQKGTTGTYAAVKYENEAYNLYVSDFCCENKNKIDILFHEFTHIWDKEYLYKKYRLSKTQNYKTHTFTEIHAEQVRFLYMLGCKTINDIPKVEHNCIITDSEGKMLSFYDFLICKKNELCAMVQYIKKECIGTKKISENGFESLINSICYYIGAVSIYNKYCTYEVDTLLDLSEVSIYLGRQVQDVLDLYCSKNIEDLSKQEISHSGEAFMYEMAVHARKTLKILLPRK